MCLPRQGAYQLGQHVVVPVRETVEKGIQSGVKYLYEQNPEAAKILIEDILIPGAEKLDRAIDLACIIYEVHARIVYGNEVIDLLKNTNKALIDYYHTHTTPNERAGWEGIDDTAAVFASGGLKYMKTAKSMVSTAGKVAETVKDARKLEKRADALEDVGKLRSPWKKNGNLDMEFQESIGGHGKKKHLHQTDEQLAERIMMEKKERENFPGASTYVTEGQMEHAATTMVKKHAKKIEEWLKNPKDTLILEHDFGSPIGRIMLPGEKSSSITNFARVVLKPSNKSPDGYVITSTFPIKKLKQR